MKNKLLVSALMATCLAGSALATEGEVSAFTIRSLAVIGSPIGAHSAGNIEITGSFTLPQGVYCDPTYVTTARARDPDRTIFAVLKSAMQKKIPVAMWISDAPALRAFPGRCSIVAAGFAGVAPASTGSPTPGPTEPPPWCSHAPNGNGCN